MARALIVGCGCRGTALGRKLAAQGWVIRGTSRDDAGLGRIEAAGFEPARADPEQPGTVLELVADTALVVWLLGSVGGEEGVASIHGSRLEALLEKLVDTPVRAFAYEAAGSAPDETLSGGAAIVKMAGARWSIPVALLGEQPGGDWDRWAEASASAALAALATEA